MSRIVNYTSAVTFNPSSYDSTNSTWPSARITNQDNGLNPSTNTTYAQFRQYGTGYTAFYNFNVTGIPQNATINSVSCSARTYISNTTYTGQTQLYAGTTAKGSYTAINSTSSQVLSLNTGTWTVSELENAKIRLYSASGTTRSNRYIYFGGADLTVNYTVNGTEYEISFNNQSSDATTDPSTTQYVESGGSQNILIYVDDIDDITITDNGNDISGNLVEVPNGGTGTTSQTANSYTTGGTFSSGSGNGAYATGRTAENPYTGSTSVAYASNGSTAYFDFNFDFSEIPNDAVIDSVSIVVNGRAESATISDTNFSTVQAYAGSTAKGTSQSFTATSDYNLTIEDPGTWTREELQTAKLRHSVGYYGGYVGGITWTVNYSTTGTGSHYTYTISNISADHTIAIDDAAGGTYYNVNASSTYAGATVSPATQSIREGRTANIQIAVSNLYEIIVKDNGTDVTSSLVRNSTGYTYSASNVQGARSITVEEATYYTVTTSSTYAGATATVTPSKVYAGQNSVVDITVDNIYEIVLKDNNVDVTSSIVEVQGETNTATFDPTQYVSSASSYSSIYNTYDPTSGVSSSGSTSRACVYSNTGSGAESKLTYKFDCSSIPQNATITNVVCAVKCSVYQTTYFATRAVQLYNGSTAKGTATTITATGSNGSVITTDGGSWTREELDDISIVERVVRGTSSTTSDASFSFWGATLSVSYTVPAGKTYTITNVSANHTIAIEEAPYYTVSTSSSYNGATVSANPAKVYSSQSSVVTITVSNLYEINVTDNGNDIKGSLAGSNGTYTYTLSNLAANHTIAVSEATKYLVAASSKYTGTTISPTSSYVYSGQSITLTISGFSAKNRVKDNGTDITSSLIQSDSNYLYTISNVSQAHEVVVYYEDNFIKVNGVFNQVRKYYKKVNGEWTEITSSDFNSEIQNAVLVYGGQQTGTTVIGEVVKSGSTVEIVINDNTLQSGTYKFVYEDEMKTPLENVDEIKEFTIS